MHEFSITENVLSLALRKANEAAATKIVSIDLVVGELSSVVPESVRFYFNSVSKGTIAEGATLNFNIKPTRIHCRQCNNEFSPASYDWACPECHEIGVDIVSGQECYMESIEVS